MTHLLDIFMKAGAILIVFLLAAVGFGLLLNITFSAIIRKEESQCISVEKKVKNVRTRL